MEECVKPFKFEDEQLDVKKISFLNDNDKRKRENATVARQIGKAMLRVSKGTRDELEFRQDLVAVFEWALDHVKSDTGEVRVRAEQGTELSIETTNFGSKLKIATNPENWLLFTKDEGEYKNETVTLRTVVRRMELTTTVRQRRTELTVMVRQRRMELTVMMRPRWMELTVMMRPRWMELTVMMRPRWMELTVMMRPRRMELIVMVRPRRMEMKWWGRLEVSAW